MLRRYLSDLRMFLIGAWFHWDWTGYWALVSGASTLGTRRLLDSNIKAGLLIWALDRFISLCRTVIINKLWLIPTRRADQAGSALIDIMDGEVMRMTVTRPLFNWKAGQHA
jgi:hypothetical protein